VNPYSALVAPFLALSGLIPEQASSRAVWFMLLRAIYYCTEVNSTISATPLLLINDSLGFFDLLMFLISSFYVFSFGI
jgi:hypothetical protein